MTFVWDKTGTQKHECTVLSTLDSTSHKWVIDLDKPTDRYVAWYDSKPLTVDMCDGSETGCPTTTQADFTKDADKKRSTHLDGRLLFYFIKDVKAFIAGDEVSISPRASSSGGGTNKTSTAVQKAEKTTIKFQEKWNVMAPFRALCEKVARNESVLNMGFEWEIGAFTNGHKHYFSTLNDTILVQLILLNSGGRWPAGTFVVEMQAIEGELRDWEVVLWNSDSQAIVEKIKHVFGLEVDESWFTTESIRE